MARKNREVAYQYLPSELTPKSDNQARYMEYLRKHPMVFAIGPAGTGKTYVAASHAIDQLMENKIEKIILTRATVPVSGEQIGYLPGNLNEKMDPWVEEIFDIFRERVGVVAFSKLFSEKRIKIIPFAFMRGRTFKNALVMCDEMQNATPAQVKMLLTRIGHDCQMLLNGDLDQSDLRSANGLAEALSMIEDQNLMLPVVRFEVADCRRSHLCQLWVEAYERA